MTPCLKCNWNHHSPIPITLKCIRCGTLVEIEVEGQQAPPQKNNPAKGRKSRLVKWVELFRAPTDRGLGDTVERLLAKAGGRKIKAALEKLKIDCGCGGRQADLNEKYPY